MFEYKGFKYLDETDLRDDGCDVETGGPILLEINIHTVESPKGERLHMDCSQWHDVTEEEFKLWVDLDCPQRLGRNPLDLNELYMIALLKVAR